MKPQEAIERLRAVIRRKTDSLATERTYCGWVDRYIRFLHTLPPVQKIILSSEQKAEAFLTHLARVRDVSASTQNQAFNALVYFYQHCTERPLQNVDSLRATRPQRIRHAPTVSETQKLLNAVPNLGGYPTNLVARWMYGNGLRVSEPIAVRLKACRMEDGILFIHGAKGGKDRVVKIPCSIMADLEQQILYAKSVFQRDRLAKIPIALPHQLARKYPEYQFNEQWAWLFPQKRPCQHPRTGQVVRWHLLPSQVQRAIKIARRISGVMCLPHELRHAYATHLLNRGINLKALQEAMGHKYIETTAGYCHADALSVPCPVDTLT